jgi:hypothetical protein
MDCTECPCGQLCPRARFLRVLSLSTRFILPETWDSCSSSVRQQGHPIHAHQGHSIRHQMYLQSPIARLVPQACNPASGPRRVRRSAYRILSSSNPSNAILLKEKLASLHLCLCLYFPYSISFQGEAGMQMANGVSRGKRLTAHFEHIIFYRSVLANVPTSVMQSLVAADT